MQSKNERYFALRAGGIGTVSYTHLDVYKRQPGRELADQELTYDVCYAKILPQDRASIVERAWRKGEQAARDIFVKYGGETDFFKIAADSGIVCECVDKDYISGNQRYFSDYISGQSRIHLYLGAIRLWAQENGMTLETAQNVIPVSYTHLDVYKRQGQWNSRGAV